jgi:hypothetical protein
MRKKRTFEEWLKEVDAALRNECGMTHLDLPDIAYRDLYDDGVSPKSAAKKAVKNAMD